jgi:rhodanese-related sulfurtransferase
VADPAAIRPHMHRKYEREEIRRRLADPTLTIGNVLPRTAWEEGRIPGSLSVPLAEVGERAAEVFPDLDQEIVLYCGGPT